VEGRQRVFLCRLAQLLTFTPARANDETDHIPGMDKKSTWDDAT
jgi:hypothetical protein